MREPGEEDALCIDPGSQGRVLPLHFGYIAVSVAAAEKQEVMEAGFPVLSVVDFWLLV